MNRMNEMKNGGVIDSWRMEYWGIGIMGSWIYGLLSNSSFKYFSTPSLHYSNAPLIQVYLSSQSCLSCQKIEAE